MGTASGQGLRVRLAGVGSVIAGQAAQSIASFVTGIALGRFASHEALGTFALGYSFCLMAISLGDTLIATPYTYFRSRQEGPDATLYGAALLGTLGVALLVSAVFWVFLLLAFASFASLSALLWILPCALLALCVRELLRRHLYAVDRLAAARRIDVLSACAQVGLVALLVGLERLTPFSAFAAIALSAGVPALYLVLRQVLRDGLPRSGLGQWLAAFAGYGRWLVLGGLCHIASVQLYPWLALLGGGERQVGLYAACVTLANMLNPLLVGLTNFFRPRFIARQFAGPAEGFMRYTAVRAGVFLLPTCGFALLAIFFGEPLLVGVYGEDFREGAGALAWISLAVVCIALSAPLQLALLAVRAPVTNLYYHATALLLTGLLALLLSDRLTLEVLGGMYAGVNLVSLLLLFGLFMARLRSR